jgi:hypothetical protein
MDLLPAWFQTCSCGCTFLLPQAYTHHKCSCHKTKKWLAVALDKAKDVWQAQSQEMQERAAAEPAQIEVPVATESVAQIMVMVSYYLMLFCYM